MTCSRRSAAPTWRVAAMPGRSASMTRVCRVAAERGVSIGAHVSYPDPAGFGRRSIEISMAALRDSMSRQIEDLQTSAAAAGKAVRYVKPHGALYHDAAQDPEVAAVVVDVVARAGIAILTLPDLHLHHRATDHGVATFSEAFADRAYRMDGTLVPRGMTGAVITDESDVCRRVLALARQQPITTDSGTTLILAVDSVCLHGDTPGPHAWHGWSPTI